MNSMISKKLVNTVLKDMEVVARVSRSKPITDRCEKALGAFAPFLSNLEFEQDLGYERQTLYEMRVTSKPPEMRSLGFRFIDYYPNEETIYETAVENNLFDRCPNDSRIHPLYNDVKKLLQEQFTSSGSADISGDGGLEKLYLGSTIPVSLRLLSEHPAIGKNLPPSFHNSLDILNQFGMEGHTLAFAFDFAKETINIYPMPPNDGSQINFNALAQALNLGTCDVWHTLPYETYMAMGITYDWRSETPARYCPYYIDYKDKVLIPEIHNHYNELSNAREEDGTTLNQVLQTCKKDLIVDVGDYAEIYALGVTTGREFEGYYTKYQIPYGCEHTETLLEIGAAIEEDRLEEFYDPNKPKN